jgi:hypothetical protein
VDGWKRLAHARPKGRERGLREVGAVHPRALDPVFAALEGAANVVRQIQRREERADGVHPVPAPSPDVQDEVELRVGAFV